MPNYKLPNKIVDEIQGNADKLMRRRVNYALLDPPITVAQVQRSAVEPDLLATMHNLISAGVQGITQARQVHFALLRRNTPGLHRDVMLYLALPTPAVLKAGTYVYVPEVGGPQQAVYGVHDAFVSAATDAFEPEELGRLAAWANEVVRIRRHKQMVSLTVKEMFSHGYIESTGHILARWPILATLVDDARYKTALHNSPKSLKAYAFPPGKPDPQLVATMRGCEPLILGAQLLEDPKPDPTRVRATLVAYEKLASDRF